MTSALLRSCRLGSPACLLALGTVLLLGVGCTADDARLDPRLGSQDESTSLLIRAQPAASWSAFLASARGLDVEARCDPVLRTCRLEARPSEAARLPEVGWVQPEPGPDQPVLDGLVEALGVDLVRPPDDDDPPTYPLDGSGVVAAIWDPDGPEVDHPDLAGRIVRAPEFAGSTSHATQVGGALGGSGAASQDVYEGWEPYRWAGVAPGVEFQFWLSGGELNLPFGLQLSEAINERGADLASHSYRNEIGGFYDGLAAALDSIVRADVDHIDRAIPFFWATANEGDEEGYFSLTNYVSAKNLIAVGATNANDDSLADFSSMGPTADGRLKPEVVAPGCYDTLAVPIEVDAIRVLDASETALLEWTFEGGVEGWEAVHDLDPLVASGGALHTTVQGRDPHMHGPDFELDAADGVAVELELASGVASTGQLYWRTAGGDWHDDRHVDFFQPGTGEVTTVRLELAEHPGWAGTILQLRLDPAVLGVTVPETGQTYIANCGTSIAAPAVAGVAALMLEAWRSAVGEDGAPPPAAYKAALVVTARDLIGESSGAANPDLGAPTPYFEGPDFATGYGLVQAPGAVAVFAQELFELRTLAEEAGEETLELEVEGEGRLQIGIAWDDPEGTPGADIVLRNDLDLVLVAPDGTEHLPWVLDASAPDAAAARGVDRLNNLEVVTVDGAAAGLWQARVRAERLDDGPQEVALVAVLDGLPISWADAPQQDDDDADDDDSGDDDADDDDDEGDDEGAASEACSCAAAQPRGPLAGLLLFLFVLAITRRRGAERGP